LQFWLYRKFIFQKKLLLEPTTVFSILGITLGVAFLIVSMAGFSGFAESLKSSIIDVSGDISVFKRGSRITDQKNIEAKIKQSSPLIKELLGFVNIEVLVANKGKLSAVLLQGVDWQVAKNLEELNRRKIKVMDSKSVGLGEPTFIGKVVAEKLKLQVGDSFRAILPKVSKSSATQISPRIQNFYVQSILDFGKYEFNERMILTDIKIAQNLAEMGDHINGYRIKLSDSDKAAEIAEKLQEELGWDYSIRDWSSTNRALFKAIRYEKAVLFFVMLIMVIAAFFNVSTTLFLGVLKRYSQISVMRALGLKRLDIISLFCFHGLVLGTIGLTLGLALGFFFCFAFEQLQKVFPIMPEEVYKLSNFSTYLEFQDVLWVVIATLVICFISTLAPAIRGSRLSPVEGLKYE
jgi:lipoprotein-releasing system permease protein